MQHPESLANSQENQPASCAPTGPSTNLKQPWSTPAFEVLPLSETYNAPNFNSDGNSGS